MKSRQFKTEIEILNCFYMFSKQQILTDNKQ